MSSATSASSRRTNNVCERSSTQSPTFPRSLSCDGKSIQGSRHHFIGIGGTPHLSANSHRRSIAPEQTRDATIPKRTHPSGAIFSTNAGISCVSLFRICSAERPRQAPLAPKTRTISKYVMPVVPCCAFAVAAIPCIAAASAFMPLSTWAGTCCPMRTNHSGGAWPVQ